MTVQFFYPLWLSFDFPLGLFNVVSQYDVMNHAASHGCGIFRSDTLMECQLWVLIIMPIASHSGPVA
jgi:hypothetical protein